MFSPDDIAALGSIKCLPQHQGLYFLGLVEKCFDKFEQMNRNKIVPFCHSISQQDQVNIALSLNDILALRS